MAKADIPVHSNQLPRTVSQDGVALREDVAYTNHKGEESSSIRKRTEKALGKLGEILSKVLEKDEAVLYVARARAPLSMVEQLAMNWFVYHLSASVLVLTNQRLLHFRVKSNGKWRGNLRSVRWGDVAEAKVKGSFLSRNLALKYRDGKKETYTGLRGGDGKKIKILIEPLLSGDAGESTAAQGVVSLCPNCRAALIPVHYQCERCRLVFKDEATAARRTLFIPGGGYFYVGLPLPGIFFAFFETIVLLGIVAVTIRILAAEPRNATEASVVWAAEVPFLFVLAIEKLFTFFHARNMVRDFIPAK